MSDWIDDPSTKAWVQHVLGEMVPKMENSALVMQVVPSGEHSEGDVKFWVELGASIMLDKPIIAVAFSDEPIPEKLRKVADEVVVLPEGVSPESSQVLVEAITRLKDKIDRKEK